MKVIPKDISSDIMNKLDNLKAVLISVTRTIF